MESGTIVTIACTVVIIFVFLYSKLWGRYSQARDRIHQLEGELARRPSEIQMMDKVLDKLDKLVPGK